MNHLIILLAGTFLCSPGIFAQSSASSSARTEETIVMKRGADQPQTTIEIRDGEVKVNGETVAQFSGPDAKTLRKKIIIDSGDDTPGDEAPDRATVVRKTVLGVLTESTPTFTGARVKQVLVGSAAKEADLRTGDRIFRVDDRQIKSSEDLVALIGGHKPGDKVVISYEREGKNRTATATLKAADPETTVMPRNPFGGGGMGGDDSEDGMPNGMLRSFPFGDFNFRDMMAGNDRPKIGLSVVDQTEGEGVLIDDVTAGSPADKAGLKDADVLTHVDGEPLQSIDDLQLRLRSKPAGEKLALRYERSGKSLKTELTIPKTVKKRDL